MKILKVAKFTRGREYWTYTNGWRARKNWREAVRWGWNVNNRRREKVFRQFPRTISHPFRSGSSHFTFPIHIIFIILKTTSSFVFRLLFVFMLFLTFLLLQSQVFCSPDTSSTVRHFCVSHHAHFNVLRPPIHKNVNQSITTANEKWPTSSWLRWVKHKYENLHNNMNDRLRSRRNLKIQMIPQVDFIWQ